MIINRVKDVNVLNMKLNYVIFKIKFNKMDI